VIDTDTRFYVDLYELSRTGRKWEPEEYIGDTFRSGDNYNQFPFCFEVQNFELFNKMLLTNGGIIAEYRRELE